ncbi:hypothetical protein RA210_U10061 [Rubrivivax sp. A210]|uniref:hypothetical protein n=1 Tax=Rubrivivax sp. A210 TaxID=2772301 RepID=UPI0019180DF9|nr:hypothetical protein [Rubrivivax sp. A210]CAD5365913.1 hypothetical protein RA210_U10061 [Rubrivivax sp. A210]
MSETPLWTTSSYGKTAETTPMELDELSRHQRQCTAASARLVAVQCGALRLHGLVSGRLVTTGVLLAALAGAGLLLVL